MDIRSTIKPVRWIQRIDGVSTAVSLPAHSNMAEIGRDDVDFVTFVGYGERRRATASVLRVCTEKKLATVVVIPDDRGVPCDPLQIETLVTEAGSNVVRSLQDRGIIRADRVPSVGNSLGSLIAAKTFSHDPAAIGDAFLIAPIGFDWAGRHARYPEPTEQARAFRRDFMKVVLFSKPNRPLRGLLHSALEVPPQIGYDVMHGRFKPKFEVASALNTAPDIVQHIEEGNRIRVAGFLKDPLVRIDDEVPDYVTMYAGGHVNLNWGRGERVLTDGITWLNRHPATQE